MTLTPAWTVRPNPPHTWGDTYREQAEQWLAIHRMDDGNLARKYQGAWDKAMVYARLAREYDEWAESRHGGDAVTR